MAKITEKEIQQIIGKDRVLAGHPIVCPNVNSLLKGQADMISVTGRGWMIEYEIKISRSDFKRDAKKGKELSFMEAAMNAEYLPNYFYYVVPKGLVSLEEVPQYAGLFYIENDIMELQKEAPVIHTKKHDIAKVQKKIITLYQQRQFLGSCLMTYLNKGIKERNALREKEYARQREATTALILKHSKKK